jgi:hypothetical protein
MPAIFISTLVPAVMAAKLIIETIAGCPGAFDSIRTHPKFVPTAIFVR